jgi:predicted ABC-type ATPase
MSKQPPVVLLVGGPNGAGKTTISQTLISETVGIVEFVNADVIAKGLSYFDPERVAFQAGRVMLERLHQLGAAGQSFAFESTLASRTFAPWIAGLCASGYELHLAFCWLRSPTLAIQRVNKRVREGGHFVPPDTVRRRYFRACSNFVRLYAPIASTWRIYDNSGAEPRLIARYAAESGRTVTVPTTYDRFQRAAHAQDTDQD